MRRTLIAIFVCWFFLCSKDAGFAQAAPPPPLPNDAISCQMIADRLDFVVQLIPVILKSIDNLWWNFCAVGDQGPYSQTCKFSGTRLVRYGADDKWVYKTATGSIACGVEAFGSDPAPWIVKHCEYTGSSTGQ
jgi:hypothetical protein